MGRIVRPVRMRPERPLMPQTRSVLGRDTKRKVGGKETGGKEKKMRVKEPDTRARRRTIDPTKWDSVHLKGMFLDVVTAPRERDEDVDTGEDQDEDEMEIPIAGQGAEREAAVEQQSEAPVQAKLKDLFAPRGEEGSPIAYVSAYHKLTHPSLHSWILPSRSSRPRHGTRRRNRRPKFLSSAAISR